MKQCGAYHMPSELATFRVFEKGRRQIRTVQGVLFRLSLVLAMALRCFWATTDTSSFAFHGRSETLKTRVLKKHAWLKVSTDKQTLYC